MICEVQGVEFVVAQPVDEPVVEPEVDRRVVIEPLPDVVLTEYGPAGAGTWQPSLLG